jgi:L-rhamnonate dehydratase
MKITDVEPIVLRLQHVDATRADGTQDAFLVRVHTDENIQGVGEADTAPDVAKTIVEMPASHSIARGLRELLVGEDPLQIDRLWQLMFHASDHYGRRGAALHVISAIDLALWDIAGKAYGQPVSVLMGGRRRERVPVYASEVMPDTADEVRQIAGRSIDAGYRALKLGWGPLGRDITYDAELVNAARSELGPERALMLDGGRAYTVKRALELLRRVEEHDLYWLEEALQPDDLDGYARLSAGSAVRIAAGEADETLPPFRALVESGHVDVLQPDLARCGGFTVARQIALLERTSGVEIVPHCFSTGILVAASLHFVATLDRATWSEYSVAHSPLVNGILTEPFRLEDGCLTVPAGPGLGVELDAAAIAHHRLG